MKIKIGYEESPVGNHLTDMANLFGAETIHHVGGNRFVALRGDGEFLRMLSDEGIGSTEEDGDIEAFEAAWDCDEGV